MASLTFCRRHFDVVEVNDRWWDDRAPEYVLVVVVELLAHAGRSILRRVHEPQQRLTDAASHTPGATAAAGVGSAPLSTSRLVRWRQIRAHTCFRLGRAPRILACV